MKYKKKAYKGFLRTIVGQEVWITLFDSGSYWIDISGEKYNKFNGEGLSGFGNLEVSTIRIMSEACW